MSARTSGLSRGDAVGRYRVEHEVGRGSAGIVYQAVDEMLERHVALKVMAAPDPAGWRVERVRREARLLCRVSSPHVAGLYDVLDHHGTLVLVMELVNGPSLDRVVARGPVPFIQVLMYGWQLAQGLCAMHAAGVVHRDIKPANLRLTGEQSVKIVDLGAARLHSACSVEADGVETRRYLIGTLPYMAPEQMLGEKVGPQADVFGAGAVLYELATGQRASGHARAEEVVAQTLDGRWQAPRSLRPDLPMWFDRLVLSALRREPGQRLGSAWALRDALGRHLSPSAHVCRADRLSPAVATARTGPVGVQPGSDPTTSPLGPDTRSNPMGRPEPFACA